MTKRARILFGLLAVAALGLSSCGGDDDDDAGADASASISDEDLDDAADAAGIDRDCLEGVQAYSALGATAGAAFSGGGADVEASVRAFEAYADEAPDEIRDDIRVMAEAYSAFYEAMADSGYDPSSGQQPTPEQMEAISAASEGLDEEEVTAAGDRVTAYFEEHCQPDGG